MSLAAPLNVELNRIAQFAPPAGSAVVAWSAGTVEVRAAAVDAIGCAVDLVRLDFVAPRTNDAQRIRQLAERLCRQLRYLVEPLEVLEVTSDPPVVQARSQPPSRDPSGSSFYELRLDASSFLLVRYYAAKGQSKIQTPMNLTREVLSRLVDDLVASAEQLA